MALQEDLTLEQGATWDNKSFPPIVVYNANDTLFDLTGYSARSMFRKHYSSANAAVTLTCTIDIANATIQRSYTAANSANVAAGYYYHDLEIYTAGNAVVRRLVEGRITVGPEATK